MKPMKLLPIVPLALLVAACTASVGEDSLLRPVAGGAIDAAALARTAPAYAASEQWIVAPDGSRLHAVLLRQPNSTATMIYFGGNGFTVGRFGAWVAGVFAPLGVDLMIVDHRGYGRSQGTPSLSTFEGDGAAAFDHLVGLGVDPARIVLHGQSLGSFIAGAVAAARPAGGVVLESSATTTEDWIEANRRGLMRAVVRRVEIAEALRGRGNLANMARIDEPLLILVGADDRTTPPRLSQALYEASALPVERKRLFIAPGAGHNDVMLKPETIAAYRAFLETLGP